MPPYRHDRPGERCVWTSPRTLSYVMNVPHLVRRHALVLSLSFIAACSSSSSSSGNGAPSGDPTKDGTPSAGDAGTDDIVVSYASRYGYATGTVSEVTTPNDDVVSIAAIATVDGAEKRFEARATESGGFAI